MPSGVDEAREEFRADGVAEPGCASLANEAAPKEVLEEVDRRRREEKGDTGEAVSLRASVMLRSGMVDTLEDLRFF